MGGLFEYGGLAIADGGLLTVGVNQLTLDYSFDGNSVALIAVPEPNTTALVTLTVLGALGARRRRHTARFLMGSAPDSSYVDALTGVK